MKQILFLESVFAVISYLIIIFKMYTQNKSVNLLLIDYQNNLCKMYFQKNYVLYFVNFIFMSDLRNITSN